MTGRQSIIAIFAVLLLLYSVPAPAAPLANLRTNVVVETDTIKLGDLFDGTIKHADKVVAYAPAPGRKLVLEATWLYRIARAYRVRWRPSSRFDRAVIERRSVTIETEQIIETVGEALRAQAKVEDALDIELDDRALRIHLAADADTSLSTGAISYTPRTGRFSVLLSAGDRKFSLTGTAHKLVQVPTLAQRLYPDDIIGARDLVWKPMRLSRLDPRTVLTESKLVGMSPRRPIVAGRAFLTTEVQPPILVKRGKRVTIYLRTKFMQLTAKGKALENGGKGDVVRVQNTDSRKTIEARVIGPEQVSVTPSGLIALN